MGLLQAGKLALQLSPYIAGGTFIAPPLASYLTGDMEDSAVKRAVERGADEGTGEYSFSPVDELIFGGDKKLQKLAKGRKSNIDFKEIKQDPELRRRFAALGLDINEYKGQTTTDAYADTEKPYADYKTKELIKTKGLVGDAEFGGKQNEYLRELKRQENERLKAEKIRQGYVEDRDRDDRLERDRIRLTERRADRTKDLEMMGLQLDVLQQEQANKMTMHQRELAANADLRKQSQIAGIIGGLANLGAAFAI